MLKTGRELRPFVGAVRRMSSLEDHLVKKICVLSPNGERVPVFQTPEQRSDLVEALRWTLDKRNVHEDSVRSDHKLLQFFGT